MSDRRDFLGASDVAVLMTGDAAGIDRLYREKIGEAQPDDLSDVWPVQLGKWTEKLNLDWYERTSGEMLFERGKVRVHPKHPWVRCTLDAWDNNLGCPVEAKHVGGREPIEVIIDRYQPQMQWQMIVTNADQCALSVIMGANEPRIEYVEYNEEYCVELLRRAIQFWDCVQRKVPPVALPSAPPPADAHKIYDMTGNNEWAVHAANWLETRAAAELNADMAKSIKTLVPADAKKAHGHGVSITRNKAGTLSLREAKS